MTQPQHNEPPKRPGLSESRSKLVDRFRNAVKKQKRLKKIQKLDGDAKHWPNLE
jgi:hypothetical protein